MLDQELSRYLHIGSQPHPSSIATVFSQGRFFSLLKPLEDWPTDLWNEVGQDIYFVFASRLNKTLPKAEGKVCLCIHVENCPLKAPGEENRACVRYGRGICLEATWAQRSQAGRLSPHTLALFMGLDKETVLERQREVVRKLLEKILADSFMVEYLERIGVDETQAKRALDKWAD